jgi:hypothetical protein
MKKIALILLLALAGHASAYTLTVTAEHGSVRVYPDQESYDSGTRVRLTPKPDVGYCFDQWTGVSSKQLVLETTITADTSITANFKTWEAPMGIPVPSFGITQTYRMYDTAGNRNESLTYNASLDAGYYTHYVDSTHGSATNTDNPYGSPSVPRLSPPLDLPAGSVVEIHNASASNGWSEFAISGEGTSAMPIFIRGVGSPSVASVLDIGYYGNAAYIIVEGIEFAAGSALGRQNGTVFENNHICIRGCEFTNSTGTSATSWTDNSLSDIVFYANVIHDNGTWDPNIAEGDEDNHGISIGVGTRMWVLDNEMYHNSGDGVQINGSSALNHIYIGRNIAWQNKQTGFWTKTAEDVVFSENVAYLHRPSSSASGAGIGFQYDPERVWFLFNTSYDNAHGIQSGSGNAGGREELYFIGNRIYHCTNGMTLSDVNPTDPAVVAANTIFDCTDGIYNGYYTCKLAIENNILSCSRYYINFSPDYPTATNSDFGRNLVYGGSGFVWGEQTYETLAAFQSGASEGVGSVEADPLFVSSSDLHLQASSPAINAGSGTGALQTAITRFDTLYDIDISKDIDGTTRPQGAGWDMGAYEFPSPRYIRIFK